MDRNPVRVNAACVAGLSLSARRAWIEIPVAQTYVYAAGVALRKESVDRNWYSSRIMMLVFGRSPQGERG